MKALTSPAAQVMVAFRVSHVLNRWWLTRPLAFLLRGLTVIWGGTEIHPSAIVGPGCLLVHSQKVVIGGGVVIGRNARIGHGVTIAADKGPRPPGSRGGGPVIGDNVTIAMDAIVVGPVTIGDGAWVGAQSLVLHDVPAGSFVRGSPARVVGSADRQWHKGVPHDPTPPLSDAGSVAGPVGTSDVGAQPIVDLSPPFPSSS